MSIFRRIRDCLAHVHPIVWVFLLSGVVATGLISVAIHIDNLQYKRDCAFWTLQEEGREPGVGWSYAAEYCEGDKYGGVGHKLYLELKKKYEKYDK